MKDNRVEIEEDEDIEINLLELFHYLKKKIKIILLVTVVFGIVSCTATYFLISKKYASNARIFIKPDPSDSYSYSYSSITANNFMVENYVEMIKGNNIQTQVANKLDVKVSVISSALSVKSVDDTQIISITATTTDPAFSKEIVDKTVDVFLKEAKSSLGVTNITIVDEAIESTKPVSPSLKKYTAVGAVLGMLLSIAIYFIKFMLDTHIHNKEEAEKYLGIPNLGVIAYKEDK